MKDYMVEHKFKSEEMRDQYFEAMKDMTPNDVRKNMKNENASFQMNWNNEKNDMVMYCWWKANSPDAIIETLEKEKSNNTVKGELVKSAFVTSTMGVSYKLKIGKSI